VLEHWNLVEADFQREYGIDLVEAAEVMSWRRFTALLGGLSANSVLLAALNDTSKGRRRAPIADPLQIASSIRSKHRR